MAFDIHVRDVPIVDGIDELIELWEATFGCSFAELTPVLRGAEVEENFDLFYLAKAGEQVAATSHLTMPHGRPLLGGLGEVATAPEFRRNGLATTLCEQSRDEFKARGGRALFLGTVNPDAHRVYQRLGWQPIEGTTLMVWLASGGRPAEFFTDYFRPATTWTVRPLTPAARVHVIPLCIAGHATPLLDVNAGVLSTEAGIQNSCMGLYPRFASVATSGECFGAWTDDGRLIGVATALPEAGRASIDAFAHPNFPDALLGLFRAAVDWAHKQAVTPYARVLAGDHSKTDALDTIGFAEHGEPIAVEVSGHSFQLRSWSGA